MLKDLLGKVAGTATKLIESVLPPMSNREAAVDALVREAAACYLGSVDENGFPCIKAMLPPRGREGVRVFYFSTNTSSARVAQYRQNNKACLYFCDVPNFKGVMLQGTVMVSEDEADKRRCWKEGDTLYYPQGVTDPDYCVLRFVAESARYYGGGHKESFAITQNGAE